MRTSFTQYCKHTLHLTIALFLLGIGGQAYAWDANNATLYFDNTLAQWTTAHIGMLIGNSGWSSYYELQPISNTSLYYKTGLNWGGYHNALFIGTSTIWGDEGKSPDDRKGYATNYSGDYQGDLNGYMLFTPQTKDNNSTLNSQTLNNYTDFNYAQTIRTELSTDNGLTYTQTIAPATVQVQKYYALNNATTAQEQSPITLTAASQTISAVRTSNITYEVSNIQAGNIFIGWYQDDKQLSASLSYTTSVTTSGNTIVARFMKAPTYAVTITDKAGTKTEQVGTTPLTIVAAEAEGYKFVSWEISGGVQLEEGYQLTNQTIKITATAEGSINAMYEENLTTGWYLRCELTNWTTGREFLRPTVQSMPQITLSLEAEKTYEFKLYNNEWYGNEGTMTANNSTDWLFETTKNNCKITTTLAGDYIFTFDITNRKLSVTYPPIPAVTTPLSIVYNTLYNGSNPLIGGDGTQDNPYLMYINKPLYLIDQTKYNTAHLYYNWGGTELLSTQSASYKDTIIPTDTEVHSLQVQAYYQYSGIRGTAATQTIYYQGVVTPKLTLSSSATEVETGGLNGTTVTFSLTTENINATKYTYTITLPDKKTEQKETGTSYDYKIYTQTGDYKIIAKAKDKYGYFWRSNTITIYAYDTYGVHIKAPTDRNIHVYTWNDATGKKNAEWPGQPISQVAQYINGWWIYPFQAPDYTHLILNDGTDSHKTLDTQITGDICFELSNSWQLTQTECQELYRIESTTEDGKKYYSNITSAAGDTMSFYAEQFGQIVIKKFEGTKWIRMEGIDNIPSLKKKSGVYTMKNPAKGLVREEDLTPYTGDYYIHTNGCSGQKDGWKSVSQLTPSEKDSARFIYFEPNDNYPNENYNHYWVRFLPSGTNLQAVIGNEYNDCLADTLKGDQCTDQYGTLTIDANVRFAYNNKTNSFTRSHLQGSNTPDYLSISGTNMHLTEGETGEDLVTARFNDISDWVYELDVYAHPGAKGHINAPFRGHDQYLFGLKTDNTPIELDILGEATDAGSYHIRLIYDYKTNRLISAWMPDNDLTINEDRPLYANMMILRKENEPAGQIILNNNAKITGLKQLYSVLEITKENWNQTGGFFWFSLPYDCLVKDVFGIPGYGNKWTIQRYRGDKRAELGWRSDIPTFWANMKQTATATIEANRGYVVAFNLTDNDFNTIDGKSILRLYFPSKQKAFALQQTSEMMTVAVPGHPCTIKDREDADRDWNVIGVPGYRNITVTANTEAISPAPQFVYVWNWNNGERSYDVTDAQSDFNYQTMYSYMTQFAGNIDWSQYSEAIAPHELQAKRGAAQKEAKMCLHLQKEDNSADRTYIYLTDKATTAFDINYDLTKIFSSSASQIGTKSQNSTLAANCLPIENCTIPVELQIATNGTYTLQMTDIPAHITALLYDRQEDKYVNLAFDNYTINLQQGNYTQRFEVQIEVHKVINELADTESRYHITCLDGQILIDNIDDKADIQLYDALGRLLYADTAYKGQTIDLPQTGIYVISINGETQRILMR